MVEVWAAISGIHEKDAGDWVPFDGKYPEKELNAIIAKYHDDSAAIRRHMIEYGILERDAESVYWVSVDLVSQK
jgi:hypothetical protein